MQPAKEPCELGSPHSIAVIMANGDPSNNIAASALRSYYEVAQQTICRIAQFRSPLYGEYLHPREARGISRRGKEIPLGRRSC